jgi:hypothetical protein
MRKTLIFTFIIILAVATNSWCQQEDYPPKDITRVGTTAASFLKIPVGARATALGGAYTSVANDVTALYWNPGGIASINKITFAVNSAKLYAGINHSFIGMIFPAGQNVFGLSFVMLNSGDMDVTTVDEPEGTGETYSVNNMAAGLTFSRQLTDRFFVGFTVKIINEKIWRNSATNVALDVGTVFNTGLLGTRIGMSISNFGKDMRIEGPDMLMNRRADPNNPDNGYNPEILLKGKDWAMPLIYRMGLAVDLVGGISPFVQNEKSRLTAIIDADDGVDSALRSSLGVEYEWNKIVALRGGYKLNYDAYRFSFGGGLKLFAGRMPFTLDYAFADYGDLSYVHHFYISVAF